MAGGAMSVDDLDDCVKAKDNHIDDGMKAVTDKYITFEIAVPESAQQIMKLRIGEVKSFIWTLFCRYALEEGISFEYEDDWMPWFKCWIEANKACGFIQAKRVQWWKEALFIIHKDGNEFVATDANFESLVESNVAFGKTPEDALKALIVCNKVTEKS